MAPTFQHPNKDMRENYLKAVEFRYPQWIPCSVNFLPVAWKKHREKLENLVIRHPWIFGQYKTGERDFDAMPHVYRAGEYYTDNWGCTWHGIIDGIEGQVVGHPLEKWEALDNFEPPDPLTKTERGERNWEELREIAEERREKGLLVVGDGERLFDRMYFLRGFTNLMHDIVLDAPELPRLIRMLEDHEMKLVEMGSEVHADVMSFHTDIGTQRGLMISPVSFRKYIKPMFERLFRKCRNEGMHVYLSSDGRLLDIVEDLVQCGVSVHDPQLRANTLEGIAEVYSGSMCVDLDLDRQMFASCTPEDIRMQIRQAVDQLSLPEGGFMMKAEICDAAIPLQNIEAICQAMDDFCVGRR